MSEDELMNMLTRAQETADIANAQVNVAQATVNEMEHSMATVFTRTDALSHGIDLANYDIGKLRDDVDTMRRALTLILGAGWDSPNPPPEPVPVADEDVQGFMEEAYGQV